MKFASVFKNILANPKTQGFLGSLKSKEVEPAIDKDVPASEQFGSLVNDSSSQENQPVQQQRADIPLWLDNIKKYGIFETEEDDDKPKQKSVIPPSLAASESGYITDESELNNDSESNPSPDLNPMVSKNIGSKEDIEREFNESQKRKDDIARSIANNIVNAAYGSLSPSGSFVNDPYYSESINKINESSSTDLPVSSDVARRFLNDDGSVRDVLNVFGFTSQNKTDDATRNLYDLRFNELGDIDPTSASADNESRKNLGQSGFKDIVGSPIFGVAGKIAEQFVPDDALHVQQNVIDDGSSPESREAIFMTGEQYLRYVNDFGIPGRDPRTIDPDELYNKQYEMENYGFIPYIVSDKGLDDFHNWAGVNKINDAFNDFTNLRRHLTDFDINHNGETYSGKDFLKNQELFAKRYSQQFSEAQENPDKYNVFDPSLAEEWAVPNVPVYTVVDPSTGETVEKVGEPPIKGWDQETGKYILDWGDGENKWEFDDEQDIANSQLNMYYRPAQDEENNLVTMWSNFEPLWLDNGKYIRADKAADLVYGNNWNNYATHNGWSNPYIENPFENFPNNFAPWVVDMVLGSAPLFNPAVSGVMATSNALGSYNGFKPGSDDYLNHTYSMVSANPTDEQRMSTLLGSAALPISERLWGPIGGSAVSAASKVLAPKLSSRISKSVSQMNPFARWLLDAAGEATEEVPGNIVEEFMGGSGLSGFYANPVLDENGNKQFDTQGQLVIDPNTPWNDRIVNFLGDAPLAMFGGGLLGGAMGLGNIPDYFVKYNKAKQNPAPHSENIVVPLSSEEENYYNRG